MIMIIILQCWIFDSTNVQHWLLWNSEYWNSWAEWVKLLIHRGGGSGEGDRVSMVSLGQLRPHPHSNIQHFNSQNYLCVQAKIRTVPKSQDPEDWPVPRCKTPFYPSSPWFRELLVHNELYRIDLKFKFTSQVWLDNGCPSAICYHWLLLSSHQKTSFSLIFKYAKHLEVEPHSLA